MRLLCIGDPHSRPEYDNDRFTWLGKSIVQTQPDQIVVMGDWADFESLCTHATKKHKEKLRVKEDIAALHDSLLKLEAPIAAHNRRMRAARRPQYKPTKHYILGNHENRVDLIAADSPELEGAFADWQDPFLERGWHVHPFLSIVEIAGYDFAHYFSLGTSGRPCGGTTGTRLAENLLKRNKSTVVGHDHRFGIASEPKGRDRIWGINAGCFVHEDYNESWCRQTEPAWDRGILLLDGAEHGTHTRHTWVTMEELKKRFG